MLNKSMPFISLAELDEMTILGDSVDVVGVDVVVDVVVVVSTNKSLQDFNCVARLLVIPSQIRISSPTGEKYSCIALSN